AAGRGILETLARCPRRADPVASGREVILFDNAGIGRSSGEVPETVAAMATHVVAFLDATRSRPRSQGDLRLSITKTLLRREGRSEAQWIAPVFSAGRLIGPPLFRTAR